MQPNKPSEANRVRVSVHFLNLVAVVLMMVVFAGCRTDTNQNGNARQTVTEQTASPSPAPSPVPSSEILPADTIIVVKEGSVEIEVNMTLCKDDSNPAHPNTSYRCDNIQLDEMEIETTGGIQQNPKPTPASQITIDGGGDKPIRVIGTPNHVMIDFPKTHYPVCPAPQPGKHCGQNNVGTVAMNTPQFARSCIPSEECKITIGK